MLSSQWFIWVTLILITSAIFHPLSIMTCIATKRGPKQPAWRSSTWGVLVEIVDGGRGGEVHLLYVFCRLVVLTLE